VYRGAIVDVDGTIRRGDHPIDGGRRGVRTLRDAGVDVCFVSNNPTLSAAELAAAVRDCGIPADRDRTLTAGAFTRDYLRRHHADDRTFVIGEAGLRDQLPVRSVDEPTAADVVVASIDRDLTYDRLRAGLRALDAGAAFVVTDPDGAIPTADGPIPGSGAIADAVAAAAGRSPDAVCGKPAAAARRLALDRLGVAPSETLVIGDRLDTDVALATDAMTAVLVETGVHDATDVGGVGDRPDRVIGALGEIDGVL
jgi:4-nitrophenyl phosphatase